MGLRTVKCAAPLSGHRLTPARFQPDNAGMDDSGVCASGVPYLVHVRHANGRVEALSGRVASAGGGALALRGDVGLLPPPNT